MTSIKIISLFFDKSNKLEGSEEQTSLQDDLSFGSNELLSYNILKRKSIDRSFMFQVLKYLKKIHIIEVDKNWKPGKRQKLKLTLFGLEIGDVIGFIENYNQCCSDLKNIYDERIKLVRSRPKWVLEEILDKNKSITKQLNFDNKTKHELKLLRNTISDIRCIINISQILDLLQSNEIYVLTYAYARIRYTYKDILLSNKDGKPSETEQFLKAIILEMINSQFTKWLDNIVKINLYPFVNQEETDFNFKQIISKNLATNFLEAVALEHSFDEKVEERVKGAIVAMLRISKPIFKGEAYLSNQEKEVLLFGEEYITTGKEFIEVDYSKLKDVEKLAFLQNISESKDKKRRHLRNKKLD